MNIFQRLSDWYHNISDRDVMHVPHLMENFSPGFSVTRKWAREKGVGIVRIHGPSSFDNDRKWHCQFHDLNGRYLFCTMKVDTLEEAESIRDEVLQLFRDFAEGKTQTIVIRGWKDYHACV